MIPNREGHEAKSEGQQQWHYLAVKKLFPVLGVITPKIMVIFIV